MDVHDGHGGYPAMGPIVDPPVGMGAEPEAAEPGPDHLLSVADARAARAALDASDALVLPDGRATAWMAVDRLVTGAWFVVFMTTVLSQDTAGGDFPSPRLKVLLAAGVLAWLVDVVCLRRVGLRPRRTLRGSTWSWLAQVLGVALVVLLLLNGDVGPRVLGTVLAVGVLGHAAVPVVRWWRASRRARGGTVAWPPGAEAFALLSLLARAESIAPERLLTLAGLPPVAGDRWLERLRAEGSAFGGRCRHWVVGDQHVGLTVPGRERLEHQRAELGRLAAGGPVG